MKELTTEEKARVLIESGVFTEDLVICNEDFIKGAYTVYVYMNKWNCASYVLPKEDEEVLIHSLCGKTVVATHYSCGDFEAEGEFLAAEKWYPLPKESS